MSFTFILIIFIGTTLCCHRTVQFRNLLAQSFSDFQNRTAAQPFLGDGLCLLYSMTIGGTLGDMVYVSCFHSFHLSIYLMFNTTRRGDEKIEEIKRTTGCLRPMQNDAPALEQLHYVYCTVLDRIEWNMLVYDIIFQRNE